jgi:hypothetical protein
MVITLSFCASARAPTSDEIVSVDESVSSPPWSIVCYTDSTSAFSLRMDVRLLLSPLFVRGIPLAHNAAVYACLGRD